MKTSDAFFAILNDSDTQNKFELLATTGKFKDQNKNKIITPDAFNLLDKAYQKQKSFFTDEVYVGIFKTSNNKCIFLYIEGCSKLNTYDKNFIEIFSNDILIAYENITLHSEIIDTQKEIISRLGSVVESRSNEVAHHVDRVAQISYILALNYGISEEEAKRIKMASPMYDVGKVAISDSILLKPEKLTDSEFEIMKTHSEIGYSILQCGEREILKTASIIAYEHHEKYDGSGYPRGLKGENIHIYGRITAIADVFDALMNKRIYKEAWDLPKVLEFMKEQEGKHFDPILLDIFFNNIDTIKEIYKN